MSISNGKQKRSTNNKKGQCLSTVAVYPILQTVQKSSMLDLAKGVQNDVSTRYIRGQCIRGQSVAEQTIVTSVAELVSEVIPQGAIAQSISQSEPIYWVRIQKCPCHYRGRDCTFIVVVGLARGYQIWLMLENGDCEEVASERKGPLKVGLLLPFTIEGSDRYQDRRPLFALVDGNNMSAENKYCTVSFLSLKHGKIIHSLEFNDSIIDMESSSKCLLVILNENIIVVDHETLTERYSIAVPPSMDNLFPSCYALSNNFLAITENTLNKAVQSCGGMMYSEEVSYGGQMMSAAKTISKTVSSIGESFVSSFSNTIPSNNNNSNIAGGITTDLGIVSVINISALPQEIEMRSSLHHYIAHFVAHESQIGYLAFGQGGELLLTSTQSSTVFHIFRLHPHATSSRLGSVQHLYTLHRGNSAAKVIHSAFSVDNRWLSISTNHGTTHLFGITPYGGQVSCRTHSGKFVNKKSRFERTAGFSSTTKQVFPLRNSHHSINNAKIHPTHFRDHPAISTNTTLCKTIANPRLTYYTPPVVLISLTKIKQHIFSAEHLSAWAFDNTPNLLSSGGSTRRTNANINRMAVIPQNGWISDSSRRLATIFGTSFGVDSTVNNNNSGNTSPTDFCLFTMNSEGILTEYRVLIRRERNNSSSSGNALNSNCTTTIGINNGTNVGTNVTFDSNLSSSPLSNSSYMGIGSAVANTKISNSHLDVPVRIKVTSSTQWVLRRNRSASNVDVIDPPLPEYSSLMQLSSKAQKSLQKISKQNFADSSWLTHVEVITYSGPHRRLWTGPQFSFGVYAPSGHSSAQLFNPNNDNSAFNASQKICPVLIEKNSAPLMSILHCDTSLESASRIVCGSWTSEIDFRAGYSDKTYASVKEKIEDAMRDTTDNEERVCSYSVGKPIKFNNSSGSSNNSANIDLIQLSGIDF